MCYFALCCRSDTVRYALDILSILTVVPKTQLLMSEPVAVLDEGGATVSTIGRYSKKQDMHKSWQHWLW